MITPFLTLRVCTVLVKCKMLLRRNYMAFCEIFDAYYPYYFFSILKLQNSFQVRRTAYTKSHCRHVIVDAHDITVVKLQKLKAA